MRRMLIQAALGLLSLSLLTPLLDAQWQLQDSGTTADFRGIDYVGNGVAWASGSNGTVLRTLDRGKTWQHCPIPPDAETLDFRGIQAFDKNTALVMSSGKGDLSRLYKTTDGCKTWKLVFTNPDPDGFWDSLRFEAVNPQASTQIRGGILIGDPVRKHFAIFTSPDFGDKWAPMTTHDIKKLAQANRNEALFAASNSCAVAVGDANNLAFVTGGIGGSRLFHLVGGGLVLDQFMTLPSFETTDLKFAHTRSSQGAFSLAIRRVDQVTFDMMIVGGDYFRPDSPGQSAFLPHPTYSFFVRHQISVYPATPPHGYRSAVAYDPKTNTWITVGPNGTDLSTDDGRNWHPLKPDPQQNDTPDADAHWNALSLPFVVGPKGRIGLRDGTPPTP